MDNDELVAKIVEGLKQAMQPQTPPTPTESNVNLSEKLDHISQQLEEITMHHETPGDQDETPEDNDETSEEGDEELSDEEIESMATILKL